MPAWLRRTLITAALLTIAAFLIVQSAWLIARDEVAQLRAMLAKAPPVPPMVRNPVFLSSNNNRDRLRDRRDLLLAQMLRAGHIDRAAFHSARAAPLF